MKAKKHPRPDCPIPDCLTKGLQRTELGTILDGVRAHLKVVHGLPPAKISVLIRDARLRGQPGYPPLKPPPLKPPA